MKEQDFVKNNEYDGEENQTDSELINSDPQAIEKALKSVKDFLETQDKLFYLVSDLMSLLPKKEKPVKILYTNEEFVSMFLNGTIEKAPYSNVFTLVPSTIALVALDELFKNTSRFEIVDPTKLDFHEKCKIPYEPPKLVHSTFEIASEHFDVPMANKIWLIDKKTESKYIVSYEMAGDGFVSVEIKSNAFQYRDAINFGQEIKKCVLSSRLLKGQIIEIDGGSGFRVVDIGQHLMPVVSESILSELEKNVINLFDKEEEFKRYGLPIKRSVILEGPPGCGKTMISRYLASRLIGKVTTIWVTSKSIDGSSDVARVFEIARKLSPSLVIMEDLDLISGTRESSIFGEENCLGEMLNQLDGLTSNDSIVLVGTTNDVNSLDDALKDRPGRFDRIYKIPHPDQELAEIIARSYLLKCGVSQEQVDKLTLASILTGSYSGAQIVEIVKGGIFEAIHRGVMVDDRCIKASKDGLDKQKSAIKKNIK